MQHLYALDEQRIISSPLYNWLWVRAEYISFKYYLGAQFVLLHHTHQNGTQRKLRIEVGYESHSIIKYLKAPEGRYVYDMIYQ